MRSPLVQLHHPARQCVGQQKTVGFERDNAIKRCHRNPAIPIIGTRAMQSIDHHQAAITALARTIEHRHALDRQFIDRREIDSDKGIFQTKRVQKRRIEARIDNHNHLVAPILRRESLLDLALGAGTTHHHTHSRLAHRLAPIAVTLGQHTPLTPRRQRTYSRNHHRYQNGYQHRKYYYRKQKHQHDQINLSNNVYTKPPSARHTRAFAIGRPRAEYVRWFEPSSPPTPNGDTTPDARSHSYVEPPHAPALDPGAGAVRTA